MIASVVAAAAAYAWLGAAVDAVRSNRDANATAPGRSRGDAHPSSVASSQVVAPAAQVESRPAQASADPGTQDPAELRARMHRLAVRQLRTNVPTRGDEVSTLPGEAQTPSIPAQVSAVPPLSLAQAQPVERASALAPEGDRMQALDVAIAQCGGGLFEQLICGQRARFRFCAGLWGHVPECPSGAAVDEPGR
jgi:hypothetical protein